WEVNILSQSVETGPLQILKMEKLAVNPATGRLLVVGVNNEEILPLYPKRGVYVGWQNADGSWTQELALDTLSELWQDDNGLSYGDSYTGNIHWSSSNEPIIILYSLKDVFQQSGINRVWSLERLSQHNWQLTLQWDGSGHPTEYWSGGY